MDAPEELATLIADAMAELDAWRASGATLLPGAPLSSAANADLRGARGPVPALAAPRPPGGGTPERPPQAPPPPRPVHAPPSAFVLPQPRVVAPLPTPGPPSRPERVVASQVQPAAPPPRSSAEAPSASPGAGLFGAKWTMALRDRGAEIESWLAARPPCPRCGRPALERKGGGSPDARLVIVATSPDGDALSPEGSAMLDKMLIHVLALERADVWVVEANPCAATADDGCRAAVLHQVTVLNPRAILGMGLRSPLGPPRRGEWTRFGEIDVLSTFHPHELLARPADKRAALDQLTELRRRL